VKLERLSRLTLIFAFFFAAFIIGPALLNAPFGPYPLLREGDILDLLTPLVLIPLYWLLFHLGRARAPRRRETLLFLVLAGLWVEGQALHLAGNAIGHLIGEFAGTRAATLVHFVDEGLSHYLWHAGLVGLSALLFHCQWKSPFSDQRLGLEYEIAAGSIYGVTYFIAIVEAATAPLGVPFALLIVVLVLIGGIRKLRQRPLAAFFFVGHVVALLCFLGWGVYWGGLPEFSQVGIID
jgi:hypothetical protein